MLGRSLPVFGEEKSGHLPSLRPTEDEGADAIKTITDDGLFNEQTNQRFFDLLNDLAEDADAAQQEG